VSSAEHPIHATPRLAWPTVRSPTQRPTPPFATTELEPRNQKRARIALDRRALPARSVS